MAVEAWANGARLRVPSNDWNVPVWYAYVTLKHKYASSYELMTVAVQQQQQQQQWSLCSQ